MPETAVILANGMLSTPFAKTTHGLVRGPSRYRILGVIDEKQAGNDAGALLDGKNRGIPIFATLSDLLQTLGSQPDACIVGVATVGGVLPQEIRAALLQAAERGITLVNGLHQLLAEDLEIAEAATRSGARILDIRRPQPVADLRFWSGEILTIDSPRIAVLGIDCAVGKRTTAALLWQACRERGRRAAMIYTGQTGWLQGIRHGFILDATPNDFVCGELERALLACHRETDPEIIFMEGQSGLRYPAGPCGSELVIAGAAHGVILQHVPGRRFYEDLDEVGCEIPPIAEEIEMIRLMGSEVWALTLNDEGLDRDQGRAVQEQLATELAIPVVFPLWDGVEAIVDEIERRLTERREAAP